jgi:hypothetical protein
MNLECRYTVRCALFCAGERQSDIPHCLEVDRCRRRWCARLLRRRCCFGLRHYRSSLWHCTRPRKKNRRQDRRCYRANLRAGASISGARDPPSGAPARAPQLTDRRFSETLNAFAMVSIKDIARAAHVSHSTVSRALRNSSLVNPDACKNTSMAELAQILQQRGSGYIDRPIVDATGLHRAVSEL